MLPVVVLPDAEEVVIAFLETLLRDQDPADAVEISNRGGGDRFVRVRRIGGTPLSPTHDRPILDVLVWDDGDSARMLQARKLHAWLRAASNDVAGSGRLYYAATVLGPKQMPDPLDANRSIAMFTVAMTTAPVA